MLVAVAVLLTLLAILFSITNSVTKTVLFTSTKIDAFGSSRAAFELMSQKLSQATLNSYWDYDNPAAPTVYYRQSDLQFLVKQNTQNGGYGQEVYFVTPAAYSTDSTIRSTAGLLNACGYFIEYSGNTNFRPGSVTTTKYRYRLMQGMEPTESLAVYRGWPLVPLTAATDTASVIQTKWTTYWGNWATFWATPTWINNISNAGTGTLKSSVAPLADNIIALVVWPRLSSVDNPAGTKLTTNYTYDSQKNALTTPQPLTANQLPPTVQITMIVISEASAVRLDTHSVTPPTAIENALKNGASTRFTDPTKYQADLTAIGSALAASGITYEVFSTSVTMKESKWSDNSQ